MRVFLCALFMIPSIALGNSSPYNALIDAAAIRHDVDPYVLRTIAQIETGKQPWAFNVDGEGFRMASKQQAVSVLTQINQNRWLVKIKPTAGKTIRQFFPNQQFAFAYLEAYQRNVASRAGGKLTVRTDDEKDVGNGQARIRQLWMVNTDIGIAQINYRYHGKSLENVQRWFDPALNLDFAASLLAKHKRKHGSDIKAAGFYHSGTKQYREIYMVKFMAAYQRERSAGYAAVAIR